MRACNPKLRTRNTSRSRPRQRQSFTELGPEVMKKQQQGLSPAEEKEKGGFSYVELNEKKSPRGEKEGN